MQQIFTLKQCLMVLAAAMAWISCGVVQAGPIDPGLDYLFTPAGGGQISIPGGSPDPVLLVGVPLGPLTLGNTDTIIQRTTGLPAGGTGTIDVEIISMSLRGIDPVEISSSFFDVFVSLDPGNPSLGEIEILTHDDVAGGGTFSSFFDVFVQIDLFEVGNPGNQITLFQNQRIETIGTTNWADEPPWEHPDDSNLPQLPKNFYPGVFPNQQRDPGGIRYTGLLPQTFPATIPIPGSAVLLATGMLLITLKRRKSRVGPTGCFDI